MRIAIVKDSRIVRYEDGLYTSDSAYRFIGSLAAYVDSIDLLSVVADATGESDISEYRGQPPIKLPDNVRVVPTYDYSTVVDYYRHLSALLRRNWPIFKREIGNADAVFLSVPSANCIPAFEIARMAGIPVVAEVVGHQRNIVSMGMRYKGLARSAAIAVSLVHERLFRRVLKGSSEVFYLGRELMEAYGNSGERTHVTFLSLVRDSDIKPGRETFGSGELRLLYAGRMSHEKGLYHLLDALPVIRDKMGIGVRLTLCGIGPELENLKRKAFEPGIRGSVDFKGFVASGDDMNAVFDESDVLLLPSISEGIPKVLVEGMARGIPLVASRVGGIPDIVTDGVNGILIEPGSAEAIAKAVAGLARDRELMCKLSAGGVEFARAHTADRQAAFIAGRIREAAGRRVRNAGGARG